MADRVIEVVTSRSVIEIVTSRSVIEIASPSTRVVEIELGRRGLPGPPGPPATAELATHVAAAEPHQAYDDLPSMRLIFENGLI